MVNQNLGDTLGICIFTRSPDHSNDQESVRTTPLQSGALDSDLSPITTSQVTLLSDSALKMGMDLQDPFILGILRVRSESPDGPQLFERSFMDCSVPGATNVHCRNTLKRIPSLADLGRSAKIPYLSLAPSPKQMAFGLSSATSLLP